MRKLYIFLWIACPIAFVLFLLYFYLGFDYTCPNYYYEVNANNYAYLKNLQIDNSQDAYYIFEILYESNTPDYSFPTYDNYTISYKKIKVRGDTTYKVSAFIDEIGWYAVSNNGTLFNHARCF